MLNSAVKNRCSKAVYTVRFLRVTTVSIGLLRKSVFCAAIAYAALICASAQAWWEDGHQKVCDLAMAQVTSETRAALVNLLDEPLGTQCSWADDIKGKRPDTRSWHYLNAPPDTRRISAVPRPEGGDIISALIEQTALMKHGSTHQRREAVLWVGHLVGDLHQPLHLGYASDLGGNTYRLQLPDELGKQLQENRDTVSMHAIWDGLILRYENDGSLAPLVETIEAPSLKDLDAAILTWADETLALLNDPKVHYRHGTRLQTLDSHYLINNRPAVDQQIQRAAKRLAALLDWAFSTKS